MRIRRTITTTLVAAATVTALGTPAEATVIYPESWQTQDVCKNVKGVQTIWDMKAGIWKFKHRTPAKWDCVKP